MKIFGYFYVFSVLFFSFSAESVKNFSGRDPYEVGQEGEAFYQKSQYKQAAENLKFALDNGQDVFASSYADICKRELDEMKHTTREAAKWYIVAADAGDGDTYSYLHSLNDPILMNKAKQQDERISRLKALWRVEERVHNADLGYKLYCRGELTTASRYLKRSSQGNHPLAQELYADICLRQLDGKFHFMSEASMWYLLSALGGDPDAFSYLNGIYPYFNQEKDHQKIMHELTGTWVRDETLRDFKPVSPSCINDYLIWKHNLSIGLIDSQKIPYFFDKVVSALFCSFGVPSQSVVDESVQLEEDAAAESPAKRPKGCRESLQPLGSAVKKERAPWMYGIVYPEYWKSLKEKGYKDDQKLSKPSKAPNLPFLFRFLLDVYQGYLKNNIKKELAFELSDMSHREYPWLEVGVLYWKNHYQKRFPKVSISEMELLRRLKEFDPIDPSDIAVILKHVERDKNVWANSEKRRAEPASEREVMESFDKKIQSFFVSDISRRDPFVQGVLQEFFTKAKKQELSYKDPQHRDLLKTPLLMHLCEELLLKDVLDDRHFRNLMAQAARYFSQMKSVKIHFEKPVSDASETMKLLKKIAKRGVEISLH